MILNLKMKYSIIIPTKDEEEGIAKVLCSIPESIKKESEIIVVDSSKDLTPKIAECLNAKVLRPNKKGKGYAMKYAVKRSKGDIIIFLDGDGTDPASYIPKLVKKLKNSDIVLGCRSYSYSKEDDPKMRTVFKIYSKFVIPTFKAIGWKVSGDPLAGFRVMKRQTWNKMNLKSNGFLIETEMNIRALELGLKVTSLPIPHLKRAGGLGKSKLVSSPKDWVKIAKYVIKYAINQKHKKLNDKLDKLNHIIGTFKK